MFGSNVDCTSESQQLEGWYPSLWDVWRGWDRASTQYEDVENPFNIAIQHR